MSGIIQPVLPMLEYVLHHHALNQIISVDLSESKSPACALKCALAQIQTECDMDHNEGDELLDMDYYPVPLKMKSSPPIGILDVQTEKFIQIGEKLLHHYILPNSPPPRSHS